MNESDTYGEGGCFGEGNIGIQSIFVCHAIL
jgi:hypothetical protein